MNCEYVRENLSDCIEGLLSPGDGELLGRHLKICSGCRLLLVAVKRDKEMLASLTSVTVPAELRERLKKRLQEVPAVVIKKRNPWKFFIPRLAPMAAAVLITVLGLNLMPGYMQKGSLMRSTDEAPGMMQMASPEAEAPPAEASKENHGTLSVTVAEDSAIRNSSEVVVATEVEVQGMNASEYTFGSQARTIPFWVKTSAGGTMVFFLWGGLVYYWYVKQ